MRGFRFAPDVLAAANGNDDFKFVSGTQRRRVVLALGHNVAIFDLNGADVVRCQLFRVKSVSIFSEEAG